MKLPRLRRNLLTGTSLTFAIAVASLSLPAQATDIVIGTATVAPVNLPGAGDTLTVSPGGSITAAGAAVTGTGASNIITVESGGVISTSGTNAFGIWTLGNDAVVTNGGKILTSGATNHGILSNGEHAKIANSGSLSTIGDGAFGIWSTGLDVSISNSGAISTSGANAHGIWASGVNAALNNSGIISTTGLGSVGIWAIGPDVKINNSGTIFTTSSASYGIWAIGDNSSISNSGSVKTTGSVAYGIGAQGIGANVTNFGEVIAADGAASSLMVSGAGSTLNLAAPSFLGGAIDTGALANSITLNITTGPSHSVLWTFDAADLVGGAPNVSGTVPGFWNAGTGQFATYDPTALSAAVDQLGALSGLISDLAAKTGDAPFWASGFGGLSVLDGNAATLNRNIANFGLAVGTNVQVNEIFRVGAAAGYAGSATHAASRWSTSLDNRSDGFFANANGQVNFEAFYASLGLSGGVGAHNDRRFVNDNLALTNGKTLGQSWASSNYNSWWVSPEITLGVNVAGPDGWALTPSAHLRYALQSLSGFTETGSNASATLGMRNLGIFEAKAELAATKAFDLNTLTLRAGVQARSSTGDSSTDVTLLGLTQAVSASVDNQYAAYVGAEARYQVTDTATLDVSAKLTLGNNVKSASASATLNKEF